VTITHVKNRGTKMEVPRDSRGPESERLPDSDDFTPSSVSDILYLINSSHSAVLDPKALLVLDRARISFVRGDNEAALSSLDEAMEHLDVSEPVHSDVMAFRLLVDSMTGRDSARWSAESDQGLTKGPDAFKVMSLCVEASEHWHSGNLTRGLRLNRSAVEHSHDIAPIWRVYALLLLIKKLSDIHAPIQANRFVRDLAGLIKSSGLHVFGAAPEALRSILHLQAGQFEEALECAATAIRASEETDSAVGVRLALSAAATAHLARREWDRAAASLEAFHEKKNYYALADSLARAAFVEIALVAEREGPRAAADLIHEKWDILSADSGCSIEDPLRPAWLIFVARRAGDVTLAERCLQSVERLAANNRGYALLDVSAENARAVLAGGRPETSPVLDFGGDRAPGGVSAVTPPTAPAPSGATRRSSAPAEAVGNEQPDTADGESGVSVPPEPSAISLLSPREIEISRLVGHGLTNQQVAHQLGLSPHTVNFHLRNIFRKLSISTRVKLGSLIVGPDR